MCGRPHAPIHKQDFTQSQTPTTQASKQPSLFYEQTKDDESVSKSSKVTYDPSLMSEMSSY